jgi:hypothetical protein
MADENQNWSEEMITWMSHFVAKSAMFGQLVAFDQK